jgi:hypothetical protein
MNIEKKKFQELFGAQKDEGHCCDGHCWHAKHGAIWMVVKDGHVIQECCRCDATRSIHRDHAMETIGKQKYPDFKVAKAYSGGPLGEGWTSSFGGYERGREDTKFRC